jgi:outer membrane murein-binding lipoprotein Lpp
MRDAAWWLKIFSAEMGFSIVAGAFMAGGIYWSLVSKVDANEEKIDSALQQVQIVNNNMGQLSQSIAVMTSQQTSLSIKTDQIESKMDRRAEILDDKLDKMTRLIMGQHREVQ